MAITYNKNVIGKIVVAQGDRKKRIYYEKGNRKNDYRVK